MAMHCHIQMSADYQITADYHFSDIVGRGGWVIQIAMPCDIQMSADYQITENYHFTGWIGRWVVIVMPPQVPSWYSKITFFSFSKNSPDRNFSNYRKLPFYYKLPCSRMDRSETLDYYRLPNDSILPFLRHSG